MALYNQQKIEEAIVEITKAKELAIKYEDQKTLAKADKTITQFYNFLGNSALREGKNEKAIGKLQQVYFVGLYLHKELSRLRKSLYKNE